MTQQQKAAAVIAAVLFVGFLWWILTHPSEFTDFLSAF